MVIDKKLLCLLSVAFAGFLFFAVGPLPADDMPEEIQIASEGYKWKIAASNVTNAIMTIKTGKMSGKKGNCKKCHKENESGPRECTECLTKIGDAIQDKT